MLFLCPNFHTSHISPVQRSFLGCLLHGFNGGPPEIWPGIFCRPLDPAGWYAHTYVCMYVLSADTCSVTQNGASVSRTQSSGIGLMVVASRALLLAPRLVVLRFLLSIGRIWVLYVNCHCFYSWAATPGPQPVISISMQSGACQTIDLMATVLAGRSKLIVHVRSTCVCK